MGAEDIAVRGRRRTVQLIGSPRGLRGAGDKVRGGRKYCTFGIDIWAPGGYILLMKNSTTGYPSGYVPKSSIPRFTREDRQFVEQSNAQRVRCQDCHGTGDAEACGMQHGFSTCGIHYCCDCEMGTEAGECPLCKGRGSVLRG